MPVGHFAAELQSFGGSLAIIAEDGERVSYVDLARRADSYAEKLGSKRRLVAIEAKNSLEPLIAYLGALRGGHPVMLLSDVQGTAGQQLVRHYDPDATLIGAGDGWTLACNDLPRGGLHPDLALLLSTSGSTGSAKAVRLSYEALDANARSIAEYLGLCASDRPITSLPIHYSYGLSVVNSHLAVGATILLTEKSVLDADYWQFFDRNGATSHAGVPYTYELLERIGFLEQEHPTLATLTQAGGRMPPHEVERWARWAERRGIRFFTMYGQTEATARIAYVPPEQVVSHPDCIGIPVPGGTLRLIDESGLEVSGTACPGELVYSGPNVMMGYALSRDDLAGGRDIEELRTGDLAERHATGLYRIVGRKSRFCKLFGLRIGLDDVERMLQRHGIAAAAAGDDELIALSVPPSAAETSARTIADELGLPAQAVAIVAADEPPRLGSGKVDYRAILSAAKAQSEAAEAPTPGSVEAIFRRAFAGADVQGTDSFVSLGGDSLNYVNVSIALEDLIGSIPADWETMSVAALRELAERRSAAGRRRLVALPSEILLRGLAILGVIMVHVSNLDFGGGANILLLLAGYNLARYQRLRFVRNEGLKVLSAFVQRIILPYLAILFTYFVFKRQFSWPSIFLVSNYFGRFGNFLEPYWFLELLLQCYLILVLIFAFARVRELGARDPWLLGSALFAASIAARITTQLCFGDRGLALRTPEMLFYLIALGWCVQSASGRLRRILTYCAGFGVVGAIFAAPHAIWGTLPYPQDVTHGLWLALSLVLLGWFPMLKVAGAARSVAATVAAASFYIYLTHGVPVYLVLHARPFESAPQALQICMAIVSSILSGVLLKNIMDAIAERWPARRLWERRTAWRRIHASARPVRALGQPD